MDLSSYSYLFYRPRLAIWVLCVKGKEAPSQFNMKKVSLIWKWFTWSEEWRGYITFCPGKVLEYIGFSLSVRNPILFTGKPSCWEVLFYMSCPCYGACKIFQRVFSLKAHPYIWGCVASLYLGVLEYDLKNPRETCFRVIKSHHITLILKRWSKRKWNSSKFIGGENYIWFDILQI